MGEAGADNACDPIRLQGKVITVLDKIQSQPAVQALLPTSAPKGPKPAAFKPADQLTISKLNSADGLKAMEAFVMEKLREAFPGPEVEESAEESEALYPSGASADQVAGTIFSGVTQVIFGAYQLQHPDMSEEDFEYFISEVREGIDVGVGEARSMLEATDSMGEETSSAIDQTLERLHERLNQWFTDTRASMFSADDSAS